MSLKDNTVSHESRTEELSRFIKNMQDEWYSTAHQKIREISIVGYPHFKFAIIRGQLLKCQQEMAQLREERCTTIRTLREKEEALEQATENERQATTEVESLR